MLQKFDVEAYLKKVEELMAQEGKNADMWLQGDTKEKMYKTFVQEFISRAAHHLKEKDGGYFIHYFETKNKRVLALLYKIFKLDFKNCHPHIEKGLEKYIKVRGERITQDKDKHLKDPILFTQQMLKFMDELNEILELCFMQDASFHDAKNTAVRRLINNQTLCPSYFAMYIDTSMQWRGDLMGKSEDEAMILLDKLITLV